MTDDKDLYTCVCVCVCVHVHVYVCVQMRALFINNTPWVSWYNMNSGSGSVYNTPEMQVTVSLHTHTYTGTRSRPQTSHAGEWSFWSHAGWHEVCTGCLSCVVLMPFCVVMLCFMQSLPAAISEQLDWIESTLNSSTAQWNVIVGHHPMVSEPHGLSHICCDAMTMQGLPAHITCCAVRNATHILPT